MNKYRSSLFREPKPLPIFCQCEHSVGQHYNSEGRCCGKGTVCNCVLMRPVYPVSQKEKYRAKSL